MDITKESTVPYPKLPNIRYFIIHQRKSATTAHTHKAFEIVMPLEGEFTIYSGNHSALLHTGDFAVINPGKVHYYSSDMDNVIILVLQLSSFFAQEYFPNLRNTEFTDFKPHEESERYENMKKLFCSAALSYLDSSEHSQYTTVSLTCHLFNEMTELIPNRLRTDSESVSEAKLSKRTQRILTYIQDHFAEPHLLTDIAKLENLTPSYISRLFSSNFNMTFQKYLMQLRLENAMRLLCTTNLPIYDICYECGFSDYRQLNRYCHEHYGKSASDCRNIEFIQNVSPIIPSHSAAGDYDRFTDQETLIYLSKIPGIREVVIHV